MSRRDRQRARRRVERVMEEAWQAVESADLGRALTLAERARDQGGVNPRILLDHGRIARLCEQWEDAEGSFRAAIALAPSYGEAFAALAELQFHRGKLAPAVRLQTKAVELSPADALAARTLAEYRAAAEAAGIPFQEHPGSGRRGDEAPAFTERTERHDWSSIAEQITGRGLAPVPGLLSPEECAALRGTYGAEGCEAEIEWDDDLEGRHAYRHLLAPLPPLVCALREELYSRAAALCNAWLERLGESPCHPPTLAAYAALQTGHRSSPRILRIPAGGGMAARRDERTNAFPLHLVADLGPTGECALALTDRRPGRKVRRRDLRLAPGDGAFQCVRNRLDRIAGVYGLQPVAWSVANPADSERFVLLLPFQED